MTRWPCSSASAVSNKRADLHQFFDAEQPGEPERGQQGVAAFGLGDQEADGGGGVDMLGDLGDGHHQADGGGGFGEQGAEIDRFGLDAVQGLVDGDQQHPAAAGIGGGFGQAQADAGGVVQLGGVQADMGMGQRQAVAGQPGAGDAERHRVGGFGDGGVEQLASTGAGVTRAASRWPTTAAANMATCSAIGRAGGGGDLGVDGGQGLVQPAGDGPLAHLAAHPGELQALHHQAQAQRVPPADIGAAIGVVADPTGQDDRAGHQLRDQRSGQ